MANLHTIRIVWLALLVVNLHGDSASAGESNERSHVSIKRIDLTEDWQPYDWEWNDDVVLAVMVYASEPDRRHIVKFRVDEKTTSLKLETVVQDAARLAWVDRDKFVALQHDHWRLFSVSDLRQEAAVKVDHSDRLVGTISTFRHHVYYYTIYEHAQNPIIRAYALDVRNMKHHYAGDGYYPFSINGKYLYYAERDSDYGLFRVPIDRQFRPTGEPEHVFGDGVYMAQPLASGDYIVCQRGFMKRRIELVDTAGRVIRTLSGVDREGVYPIPSPSGKYVAYSHSSFGDQYVQVVEVVDIEGQVVHRALAGESPLSASYRWSHSEDQLAIVVSETVGKRVLEIVTIGE